MKISKILQYLLMFGLFLIIVLIVIAGIPSIGSYQLLVVRSGSMEPAIKVGSLAAINPAEEYKKGDIITFSFGEGETLITHRIYNIKDDGGQKVYTAKGDANNAPDPRDIFEENIIGKVLFSIPYVGYAADFAKRPAGFILLFFIPAGIIIYDQGKNIFQEIKKKKKQK